MLSAYHEVDYWFVLGTL